MIRVNVLYAKNEGDKFDMNYYMGKHIPMVQQKLGSALKAITVEEGVGGGMPGTPATFSIMAHLSFDSMESYQQAFGPHAGEILGDVPNYTNIVPAVQVSNVKL